MADSRRLEPGGGSGGGRSRRRGSVAAL